MKSKTILNWEPKVSLEDGVIKTEEWIKSLKLILRRKSNGKGNPRYAWRKAC